MQARGLLSRTAAQARVTAAPGQRAWAGTHLLQLALHGQGQVSSAGSCKTQQTGKRSRHPHENQTPPPGTRV